MAISHLVSKKRNVENFIVLVSSVVSEMLFTICLSWERQVCSLRSSFVLFA